MKIAQPPQLYHIILTILIILLIPDFDVNRFNPETDLETKLARISKFDQSFRKKGLVTQHLRLVRAKTHLQNNQHKETLQILNQMQTELEKVRELPKAILSLLNEVWAAYQWTRGQFERCHQSLLSFLVYCELDALDWREKEQVVYRLMWCRRLFLWRILGSDTVWGLVAVIIVVIQNIYISRYIFLYIYQKEFT